MYPILLVAGENNKTYQYLFLILKKNQHFYVIYHILGSNMNVNNGQILTPQQLQLNCSLQVLCSTAFKR